jgi:hypothetical protein
LHYKPVLDKNKFLVYNTAKMNNINTHDLKRLKFITARYHSLQGLKALPWFVLYLTIGLVEILLNVPPGRLDYACGIGIPGTLLAWWLSRQIGEYYCRTYGQVQRSSSSKYPDLVEAGAALAILFPAFFIDTLGLIPVSVFGLGLAVVLAGMWLLSGRILTHYWVMAVIVAGLSLLPVTGVLRNVLIRQGGNDWHLVLMGVVFIFGSVFDHLMLVRNLKPAQEEGDGGDI